MLIADKSYVGTMLSEVAHPNLAVLFKSSGLDFFLIDTEHGGFDYTTLTGLIMNARLSGIPVFVRLADNTRKEITRLMDMGADGLLLPMTGSAEDIEAVVRYAKYAPIGKRGISTMRGHTLYQPPGLQQYMQTANERTAIFAQIETKAGVERIDDILRVEGVSGAIVGPNDLACDLDSVPGDLAPIMEAMSAVADASRRHGKASGVITADEILLRHAKASGMGIICCGSELHMLKTACSQMMRQIEQL